MSENKLELVETEKTEEQVVTQQQVDDVKAELDEYEQSAVFINQAIQHFRQVAYTLAEKRKRGVARVLEHILFDPMEEVTLMGKEEEKLVAICQSILYHKNKLMEYAIQQHNNKEGSKNAESKDTK